RLGAWLISPPPEGRPEDGLLLILNGNNFSAKPASRLLYSPVVAPERQPPAALADAEALEFQQAQPERALEIYRRLAETRDPDALMRMARVLRKMGRSAEARTVYATLAGIDAT